MYSQSASDITAVAFWEDTVSHILYFKIVFVFSTSTLWPEFVKETTLVCSNKIGDIVKENYVEVNKKIFVIG